MYIITLKEPVRSEGDMKTQFIFAGVNVNCAYAVGFVEGWDAAPMPIGKTENSYFPISNIYGIVWENKLTKAEEEQRKNPIDFHSPREKMGLGSLPESPFIKTPAQDGNY